MLNREDLAILQRRGKTSRSSPVEDSMHITWYLPCNLQLNRSSRFWNIRKSDIVGEVPKMFNVSIHSFRSLYTVRFGGHLVCL